MTLHVSSVRVSPFYGKPIAFPVKFGGSKALSSSDFAAPDSSIPNASGKSWRSPMARMLKKYGPWGLLFFTVKGILSTTLGVFLITQFKNACLPAVNANRPGIQQPRDPEKAVSMKYKP